MANTAQMWRVHNLAKTYGSRPSEVVGLENTWDAFTFDSACAVLCNKIEAEMDLAEEKAKTSKAKQNARDGVLRKFIPELAKARKFADPGKR